MKTLRYAAAAAIALVPAVAMAGPKTASGTSANGVTWTAESRIVGQTSTGTAAAGGNPLYFARNNQGYSGVVGLLMEYNDGSAFVCSGSLTYNNRIVTAGHCVSNGAANDVNGKAAGLVRTSAFFLDQSASVADNQYYFGGPGITEIEISGYNVNSLYTGEVIDQNDIAVLTLAEAAPAYAQAYGIYTGGDLTGVDFNVAGYGGRSTVGGAVGVNAATGRRRQGDNRYDFAWGDAEFNGLFTNYDPECNNPPGSDPDGGTNWFCGYADIEYSYISDFDNGSPSNDASCYAAVLIGGVTPSGKFCNLGRGATEVSIAGGDSGGPGFVNGKISSVNSYGLSFGPAYGDFNPGLNSSWGEMNGFVPTFIHAKFLADAVPEPSTWTLMILGFGMVGGAMRRKTKLDARYAF